MKVHPDSRPAEVGWEPPRSSDDADWRDRAACREYPTETFFPEADAHASRRARRICQGCPVVNDCLEYAMRHPEVLQGIWGGLTERDREKLRRQRSGGVRRSTERRRANTAAVRRLESAGYTRKQIAEQLGLTAHTVWTYSKDEEAS